MRIGINKAKNIILMILYYFAIAASYVYWVSPHFSRAGFIVSYSLTCSIVGFLVACVVSIIASGLIDRGKVSDIILLLIVILYFFPQIVLFTYCLHNWAFFLFVILYLTVLVCLNYFIDLGDRKVFISEHGNLFVAIVVMLSIFMVVISGAFTGFRISFDLSDYYEYRFAAREFAMPTVVKYVFNWAKTILPIGLVYAMLHKKWWLVVITSISEMLCFSFDGKKSSLFMFVLAFGIALFYKKEMLRRVPFYMILVNIALFVEQAIRNGESFIGKNILRRMMYIPAYLGWAFFDFFQSNELDYFRSSFLRRFGFSSPYSEGIPRIIGRIYNVTLSSIGAVNANTGLCGDAYANLGWFSIIIFPFAIVLIIKIIEKYLADLDSRLQIMISLTVAYTFMSGALFTALLTNGILVLILMLIIMPRSEVIKGKTIGVVNEDIAY